MSDFILKQTVFLVQQLKDECERTLLSATTTESALQTLLNLEGALTEFNINKRIFDLVLILNDDKRRKDAK